MYQCSKKLVKYKEYSCFDHSDFPTHSVFTFDVCWGSLGTVSPGTQVQPHVILDPDYLPDYFSVSYDYKKNNFITQLILEIKLTHYFSELWACPDMSDHTHLKQTTNICCFYGTLVTSKNSTKYFYLFVQYCSLKNPAFWLFLRFLDHNWRARLFPNTLFLWKVKGSLKQKSISEWIRFFVKTLNILFLELLSPPSPSFYFRSGDPSLFLRLISREKNQKKLMIWKFCIADGWKIEQSQIYRTLLLGWLSN